MKKLLDIKTLKLINYITQKLQQVCHIYR